MQKLFRQLYILCSVFMLGLFFIVQAQAQTVDKEPAIFGYSPVSYFTEHKAEKGYSAFQVSYQGDTYYFTSKDQVELFNGNPKKYAPHFKGFCAYSLTLGRKQSIDPTNFKIVDGFLLLFHKSDDGNGLKKWEHHKDDKELLETADYQYKLLKF